VSARSMRPPARHVSLQSITPSFSIGVLVIAALLAAMTATRSLPHGNQGAHQGYLSERDVAPDFTVQTARGDFSLAKARRPVLLEIFGPWCSRCRPESVILNDLYGKYRGRIEFIAVTASPYARGFTQYFDARYPIGFDATLGVAKGYSPSDLPMIVLIGADKRIEYLGSGEVSAAVLASRIRGLL
jgi:thiol-disulfide isomerase/thioredoxin